MAIEKFFNIAVCAEIAALIAALIFVSNKRSGYWRLFIAFLILTLIVEGIGFYYKSQYGKSNYPVYNSMMVVQLAFFAHLFSKFLTIENSRRIIWSGASMVFMFILYETTKTSFIAYNKDSRILLSIFVVFFSCLYFYYLLKSDSVKSPISQPSFWVVTGLFFFYFGTAVMFSFYTAVAKIKLSGNVSFYDLVMGVLSCILYGSWIIAFVWKRKQLFKPS